MAQKEDNGKTMQDLKAAIKAKQPERFYIFHGVETFLMHHYTQRLQKLLVDELTESFNFHKLTQESFDIRSFAEAVENLPMMAESTFVWVDDVDIFKFAEGDRERMAEIFSFIKFGQPGAILLSDGDVLMSHWFADAGEYKTVATRIKLSGDCEI